MPEGRVQSRSAVSVARSSTIGRSVTTFYVSLAHGDEEIGRRLDAFAAALEVADERRNQ
jgi:hypothetical protein